MERILITGITGQDGKYLSKHFLSKTDNKVIGITRNKKNSKDLFKYLQLLGVNNFENLDIVQLNLENKHEVESLIHDVRPTKVFNLSGPSSVYESLDANSKSEEKIRLIFDNLTNSLIQNKNLCVFFQASSSEMYSGHKDIFVNEHTKILPNSPYGDGKAYCHISSIELNEKYNWDIVSGVVFNHESAFRSKNFLFSKIINSAIENSKGNKKELIVGTIDYIRDWSHAIDVVNSIIEITNNPKSSSYIIGSGIGHTIGELIMNIYDYFDLNYLNYLSIDNKILRDGDATSIIADTKKLKKDFQINPFMSFKEMIAEIIELKIKISY